MDLPDRYALFTLVDPQPDPSPEPALMRIDSTCPSSRPPPVVPELMAPAPAFVMRNHFQDRPRYFDAGYRLGCAEIAISRGEGVTYDYVVKDFETDPALTTEMLVFFARLHRSPYLIREPAFLFESRRSSEAQKAWKVLRNIRWGSWGT